MTTTPDKLQQTPLKEDIEASFKLTQMNASMLRNMINCRCPGNTEAAIRKFMGTFDYFLD